VCGNLAEIGGAAGQKLASGLQAPLHTCRATLAVAGRKSGPRAAKKNNKRREGEQNKRAQSLSLGRVGGAPMGRAGWLAFEFNSISRPPPLGYLSRTRTRSLGRLLFALGSARASSPSGELGAGRAWGRLEAPLCPCLPPALARRTERADLRRQFGARGRQWA